MQICQSCGVNFHLRKSHVERGGGKFCSQDCQQIFLEETFRDRFWNKVNKTSDCWTWTGKKTSGYGIVMYHNKELRTHRVAWYFASNIEPDNELPIIHTCDNRACVRNDEIGTYTINGIILPRFGHLVLATILQNNQDMTIKGRGKPPQLKLTTEQVIIIRQRVNNGERRSLIASEFNITPQLVGCIVRRTIWKHID